MNLSSLDLEEFRTYRTLHLDLGKSGLRLFGANASGKTSLLEAVAMLATTRSPRTSLERDAIAWGSGDDYGVAPYARCRATVDSLAGSFGIALAIEADPARGGKLRKDIKIDGRPLRAADAVGRLKAVLFSVEDVALISGPPLGRRRFLDLTISQLDGRYLRALSNLNRVLTQRNSLLKSFARDRVHPNDASVGAQLAFWDEELVRFGSLVFAYRLWIIGALSDLLNHRFASLAGGRDVRLGYQPNLDGINLGAGVTVPDIEAASQVVARDFTARLADARRDEVRRGITLIGPHRDDIGFSADGVDIGAFGSRGEQRLVVVALKLAEADLMHRQSGESPVLLLDDVLSELDERHRDQLVTALAALESQILVTATDRNLLAHPALGALPEARVSSGVVEPVD